MSLRPARFADTLRLVDMLVEQHAGSRFVALGNVDREAAQKLIAGAIQRNGNVYAGGTLVNVIEVDGVIEAFGLGSLQRVYLIGDRLEAVDVFLVASDNAPPLATRKLLAAYVAWAESNPRVIQTILSHTDALPTGERMAFVYARMRFTKSGEMWRRDIVRDEMKEAA